MLDARGLQIGLGIAVVASLVIMLGLFSVVVRVGCLVVMAGIVVASASARRERGGGWWVLFAVGVLLSIAAALIAQPAQTLGGVLAIIGGLMVIIAATIGFPATLEE